jgi:hypothetical protein
MEENPVTPLHGLLMAAALAEERREGEEKRRKKCAADMWAPRNFFKKIC